MTKKSIECSRCDLTKLFKTMSTDQIEFKYGVKVYTLGEPELKVRCCELSKEDILTNSDVKVACSVAHSALRNFRCLEGFGRAIAAPQVGHLIRMIAMNLNGKEITLFNPVVTKISEDKLTMWDDCLSFPDLMCCVERSRHISVVFNDSFGEEVTWNDCDSDISELLQHEIDHLDGILAVDRAIKPNKLTVGDSGATKFVCEAIINRVDWLANKEFYNSFVSFHY
jgi:peptide deformylase